MSEPAYRQEFEHTGFWGDSFGRLLMEGRDGQIIGEIMFFKTVQYMDELEIGYRLFGKEHWGKGATSEALQLLTRYLFTSRTSTGSTLHRRGISAPSGGSKVRIPARGTMRGCMFHRGRYHDMELYAMTRRCSEAG
jgi:RimJ/RimL family protein N-acetyltransferase